MTGNHLVPEKRLNKNGILVTKHVLANTGVNNAAPLIPAPSLMLSAPSRKEYKDLKRGELVEEAKARFNDLGVDAHDNFWTLLQQVSGSGDKGLELASEKFYDLLSTLDETGMKSLSTGGFGWLSISETNAQLAGTAANILGTAILAYERSREVDDAISAAPNENNPASTGIYKASELFFKNQKVRCSPEVAADLGSEYLLRAMGLGQTSFPTVGDYYRGLNRLNERREEIKPYLPLLIAMNTAYTDNNKSYYFNDEYYLWDNIELVKQYPVDRIGAIARSAVQRGEFDEVFALEISNSNHDALNAGIL